MIVDASSSDCRIMAGLLMKAGYDPITAEDFDAAKEAVEKLPLGAVIVTAMKFTRSTAQDLIKWQRQEGLNFPTNAIVDNLNPSELLELMRKGMVDVVQRPAIDKQLAEIVKKYAKPENIVRQLDNALIPRSSKQFKDIEKSIAEIAATNANCIIFGECDTGKEQIAHQIYLQSSRTQKPLVVVEAGGAALVGKHGPESDRSEIYDRIEGYFSETKGGTVLAHDCLRHVKERYYAQLLGLLTVLPYPHIAVGVSRYV